METAAKRKKRLPEPKLTRRASLSMPKPKMSIQKRMEGYVMSCMIYVASTKLHGPKLRLKPMMCMKISRYYKLFSYGAAHSIRPSRILQMIMTRWPYSMKARLPYFSRNWPAR